MLKKIVLLCVLATSAHGSPEPQKLIVKLGVHPYQIEDTAKNIDEVIDMEWIKKDRPAGPAGLESLELWCPPDDYSYCTLLDDTGYRAGIQLGVAKNMVKSMEFDAAVTGFTNWTTTLDGEPVEYYAIQLYFISAEILKTSKESRLANRKSDRMLQHGNIWMTGFNGKLYTLPLDTSLLGTAKSDFTKQGCVTWLGQHYFYKMSNDTTCSADTLFPWFPFMDAERIIGIGFIAFMNYKQDEFEFFEYPDKAAVKAMVPNGPKCLYDLTAKGVLTMHVFIEETRKRFCPSFFG